MSKLKIFNIVETYCVSKHHKKKSAILFFVCESVDSHLYVWKYIYVLTSHLS